ncbi:hypothetical protein [Aeromonas phage phiA014S]|uniref:Uncharacterized protein n=1 Tax=Aeromonas phage phiA014S TaxID=3119845 RepID=A0ABZ2CS82_9CAUD
MPTLERKVMRKRETFRGQATHTSCGKLYKSVNGQLYVLRDMLLFQASNLYYPVWSKCADHQKPSNLKSLNKENT